MYRNDSIEHLVMLNETTPTLLILPKTIKNTLHAYDRRMGSRSDKDLVATKSPI